MKHVFAVVAIVLMSLTGLFSNTSVSAQIDPWQNPCQQADMADYIFTMSHMEIRRQLNTTAPFVYVDSSFVLEGNIASVTTHIFYRDGREQTYPGDQMIVEVTVLDCYLNANTGTQERVYDETTWQGTAIEAMTYRFADNAHLNETVTVMWLNGVGEWQFSHTSTVGLDGDVSFQIQPGDYVAQDALGTYTVTETGEIFTAAGVYMILLNNEEIAQVAITEDEIAGMPRSFIVSRRADLIARTDIVVAHATKNE